MLGLCTLKRLSHALLRRTVVLAVIALLIATTAVSALLSARVGASPLGSLDVAQAGTAGAALWWWSRLLVFFATLQLVLATVRLARRDVRRARRVRGPGSQDGFRVDESKRFADELKRMRYLRVGRSVSTARYVRDVWGYAGPALLHLGMIIVAVGALTMSLTQSSGTLWVSPGLTEPSGTIPDNPTQGLLASDPVLASTLRCDGIDLTYWPTGELRRVTGTYSLLAADGVQRISVSTNDPVTVQGLRFFQDPRAGYAFGITLDDGGETTKLRLDLIVPGAPDEVSYLDTELENGDLLRAKVTHDPGESTGAPVLTLRLVRAGEVLGEDVFTGLGGGQLGEADVSVDVIALWGIVVFERSVGSGLLFAGFFVIALGAALIYGATPREITLLKHEDGSVTAHWHATRFATLYTREEARLRASASTEERDD